MAERVLLEELQHGEGCSATDTGLEVIQCHDGALAGGVVALAHLAREHIGHDVRRDGVETTLGYNDSFVLLRKLIVLGDHVVDPWHFTSRVQIVRAIVDTGGKDRLTVVHEGAYCRDDECRLLDKSLQLLTLKLACLDGWCSLAPSRASSVTCLERRF